MENLPAKFWDELYNTGQTGWDIGYVSTPLKAYFDQLSNQSLEILIPGAGNAYEAEYLYKNGFNNTFVLDYAAAGIHSFKNRFPSFPEENLIKENFFDHIKAYDLVVEQTFFSSILRSQRIAYAEKMYQLLKSGGKLIGLLFNHEFRFEGPPFGGTQDEYKVLFEPFFKIKKMEIAHNSIKPRAGRELFIILQKK
jgi:thiopurine S-methyltransferase